MTTLADVQKLLEKATPGEWTRDCGHVYAAETEDRLGCDINCKSGNKADAVHNSRAIAAAINYLRSPEFTDLVAERDRLRITVQRTKADAELGQQADLFAVGLPNFTGEPPYVGNDGVMLALRELKQRAEAAEAKLLDHVDWFRKQVAKTVAAEAKQAAAEEHALLYREALKLVQRDGFLTIADMIASHRSFVAETATRKDGPCATPFSG